MVHSSPWETRLPGTPLQAFGRSASSYSTDPILQPGDDTPTHCDATAGNCPGDSAGEGRAVVFNHLLGELSATLMLLDGDAFRSLGAHLDRHAKLGPTARREMREWLESARPAFSQLVSRQEMHWIFYHTYFWSCLEMGPVETDRHFARALRSAGELPEAIRYKPQSFL